MAKVQQDESSVWRDLFDPGNVLLMVYIGVMMFVLLFGNICSAATAEHHPEYDLEKVRQGELLLATEDGRLLAAPQLEQQVAIAISGMVSRVKVHQKFVNTTDTWLEAIYVFPLPEESSVDGLRMQVGERVIEGRVMEKQQAAQTHEKAKAEGKKSSLLSQQRANIFTTKVANLGPGEQVAIELTYQQLVEYRDGQFSLRFPMVVGPRYIPGHAVAVSETHTLQLDGTGWAVDTDQVPDASAITPPVDTTGSVSLPVMLEVDLAAGFPIAEARSLYHTLNQKRLSGDHWQLKLVDAVMADRDFVLQWRSQTKKPVAALFAENLDDSQYLLLMLTPPIEQKVTAVPREVIFVLDVSGSMAGISIEQAKAGLLLALDRLRPDDRFNIIAFNDHVKAFHHTARSADREGLLLARRFVQSLNADGGTEMKPALMQALDGSSSHEYLRQVVFLTDGAVGNEEELFGIINKRLGDSRLFPIGIGSAPNSHFMRRAARIGRGTFTYIGNLGEVEEKMSMLLEKITAPVITNLKLDLDTAEKSVEIYPDPLPDLYAGEPIVAVIRTGWLNNYLRVSGRLNSVDWQTVLDTTTYGEREGIAKLWARKKISNQMEQLAIGGDEQKVRDTVLAVALEHQLVSRYTSFIAVDTQVSRPVNEQASTRPVTVKLPQGWQANAVFGGRPQTATPAQLRMMIGITVLLGGFLLYFRKYVCLVRRK